MIKKFDDPLSAMKAVSELNHRSVDVKIGSGDFVVTVRTLGTQDETNTFINCMHLWGQAFIYKHKVETLIRAITKINGLSLEDISEKEKREIIEEWNQDIVDEIYLEYAKLIGSVESYLEKIQLTAETNVIGAKDAEVKKQLISNDEE